MKPAISIKGLSVSYDRKVVLANVYLDIEPGNVYGIIGPNGAGKSTLFKAILGLVEANTGVIEFFNDDFKDHRKQIAYVPQRDDIDWDFPATVFDIVLMGRYPYKKLLEPINKLAIRLATRFVYEGPAWPRPILPKLCNSILFPT